MRHGYIVVGCILLSLGGTSAIHSFGLIAKRISRIRNDHDDVIWILRGGANKNEKKKDSKTMRELLKEEEDELEEEDGEEGEGESMETQSGNGVVSAVQDMWVKTPPITQIYIGTSMLVTLLSCAFNKNAWPKVLNFDWKEIMLGFQWWRLVTPFLFFGPLGLNYGLTIQFVWIYMAQLEKLHYNNPEEYFMLLLFGAVSLIGGYTMLGLSTKFLGHNLSTYLVYIWARVFEGTDVNVMDLFVLKAELLPWFFCAQTMILEGELPFADILGIVVGHLYHYLTQQKILVAPQFLKDAFSTPAIREKYAKFRGDFE